MWSKNYFGDVFYTNAILWAKLFNFNFKTIITNYGFNFLKMFKTVITNYGFDDI